MDDPQKDSAINRSIASLREEIEELADSIDAIIVKLSPVLRPESPVEGNKSNVDEEPKSLFRGYIDEVTGRVNQLHRNLDAASDRLDI